MKYREIGFLGFKIGAGSTWNFKNCKKHEEEDLQRIFNNPQSEAETKSHIGCQCEKSSLVYDAEPVDPLNTRFRVFVRCVICDQKGSIEYNTN